MSIFLSSRHIFTTQIVYKYSHSTLQSITKRKLADERELSHILPTFAMEADCYGRLCPRCNKPLSTCKRFVCPRCNKLFSTCYSRNHHLVTEHDIENEPITSTGDKESSASETTNVRRSVRISRR